MSTQWAEPKIALNVVGFPNCLDPSILADILRGGADKVKEAGAVLVGGHSVQDNEPKYGLCFWVCASEKMFKNYGCRPGDALIFDQANRKRSSKHSSESRDGFGKFDAGSN